MKKFFHVCLVLTLVVGAILMIGMEDRMNTLQAEKSALQRKRDAAQTLYEQAKKELAAVRAESEEERAAWQTERTALAGEADDLRETLAAAQARGDAQEKESRRALEDARAEYDQALSAWETEKSALIRERNAAEERLQAVTRLLLPEEAPGGEEAEVSADEGVLLPAKDLSSLFAP